MTAPDRATMHAIRRAGVVERAKLEIDSAAVKGSAAVRRFYALANPTWTPAQCHQMAAAADMQWCGIFALAMLHEEGLGVTCPWVLGRGFVYRLPQTDNPQPGDVFVGPPKLYHHGIVERRYQEGSGAAARWWLASIEGNTPAVVRRDRPEPRGLTYYSIEPWIDGALAPPVGA